MSSIQSQAGFELMKNVALILAFVFAGGCSLYADLTPLGEGSPDLSIDMVFEPDFDLDMSEDASTEEMGPTVDQSPDIPEFMDMFADADADVDVDLPQTFDSLLGEALLAYDFRTFSAEEFPSLVSGGEGFRVFGDVERVNGSVRFGGGSLQAAPPQDFYSSVVPNESFSLSLWLRTSSTEQVDPRAPNDSNYNGRIFSLSPDSLERNFMLAQWKDWLVIRFRDFTATINGLPMDEVEPFFALGVQHIAVSVSSGTFKVYLDGTEVFRRTIDGFNWDPSYAMNLGNEGQHWIDEEGLHDRPWSGEIFDLRGWDRALNDEEITLLFKSGIP